MTPKQQIFCDEYLIDLNATQAAIRAGYSEKTSYSIGVENLNKPEIQNYISEKQLERSKRTEITADRVLEEFAKIGFANVQDFVNGGNSVLELKGLPSEKAAAVSAVKTTINEMSGSITTELKFHSKVAALEMIGRHLGMFEKDNKQKQTEFPALMILPTNGRDSTTAETKGD